MKSNRKRTLVFALLCACLFFLNSQARGNTVKIKSSQGEIVCVDEMTLLSLSKNYNASSYLWEKQIGTDVWTAVGTTKSIKEKISEKVSYRVTVDGTQSDTLVLDTMTCCSSDDGQKGSRTTVFFDDFGYFPDDKSYVDGAGISHILPTKDKPYLFDVELLGQDIPDGKYDGSGRLTDEGSYAIVSISPKTSISSGMLAGVSSEHTGEENGGALLLNISDKVPSGSVLYEYTVNNLCPGKTIYFEAYVAFSTNQQNPPIVSLNVLDLYRNQLTDPVEVSPQCKAGWKRVNLQFVLKEGVTDAVLQLRTMADPSMCRKGNDLLIDDIRFMVCSPPNVEAYSELSTYTQDTTICTNMDITISAPASDLLKNYYTDNQYYLFQHSLDGTTWKNISQVQKEEEFLINTADYKSDKNMFRVVVARQDMFSSILNEGIASNDYCKAYSMSDPITITRIGLLDMGANENLSGCENDILQLKGSTSSDIVSWSWEKEDGTVLVPLTNNASTRNYDLTLTDSEVIYFTGYTVDGCKGRKKFIITKNPIVEVSLDSTMACDLTTVTATTVPSSGTQLSWSIVNSNLDVSSVQTFTDADDEGALSVYGEATGYCKSLTVNMEVKVNVTPDVPTVAGEVSYIKGDMVNDSFTYDVERQFKQKTGTDLISHETGSDLVWYDTQGNRLDQVPTPTYRKDILDGEDERQEYYVSQKNKQTGCESKRVKVLVTIFDSPMPNVVPLHYCEGESALALTAQINDRIHPASDYALKWYLSNPAEGGAVVASITPKTTINTGLTQETTTYYVTQQNNTTGAESRANRLEVTVYAKPVISATNPDPICEKDVDISSNWKVTNGVPNVTPKYYSDEQLSVPNEISSVIENSGTYYVRLSYVIPNSTTGEQCFSNVAKVDVDIHDLSIPVIDGKKDPCPNTEVSLFGTVSGTNPGVFTYNWKGSDGSTYSSSTNKFTTNTLTSSAGSHYTFDLSVTSGVCTKTAESFIVTIADGPVVGTMTLMEADNTWKPNIFGPNDEKIFYSCGGEVTINADYTKTSGDFTWTEKSTEQVVAQGETARLSTVGTKTYEVSFVNECPTKTEVTIHSIPLTVTSSYTLWEVCEGESFSSTLAINCDETPSVKWYKDGVLLPETSNTYSVQSSEPTQSGVYSYEVSNRGCLVVDSVADGKPLKVKPYIRFTNQTEPYIVVRGETATIPLSITVPNNGIPNILWKEKGQVVNTMKELSILVEADHSYAIELSDPNYCPASSTATIYVDAKLKMELSLADTMCFSEVKILSVDTAGTGAFRKGVNSIKVVEVCGGVTTDKTSSLKLISGKLGLEVTPAKDAKYTVTFEYDGQQVMKEDSIVVLQPIEIVLPAVQTVCEGSTVDIDLVSVYPVGTTIAWRADPSISSGLDDEGITVTAVYKNGQNHRSTYKYEFIASYVGCEDRSYSVDLKVDEALTGELKSVSPICAMTNAVVDASTYEASSYIWYANEEYLASSSSVSPTLVQTTDFKVNMERGTCKAVAQIMVVVSSIPVVSGLDSIDIRDRNLVVDPFSGTPPYTYWLDSNTEMESANSLMTGISFSKHVAYVKDAVGCVGIFPFELLPPPIYIPEYFTPNGDGLNDCWVVVNLREVYPSADVSIYDRFGKLLVKYKAADDDWDGKYRGEPMPSTDYWYLIDIDETDKIYSGHFTLMRR